MKDLNGCISCHLLSVILHIFSFIFKFFNKKNIKTKQLICCYREHPSRNIKDCLIQKPKLMLVEKLWIIYQIFLIAESYFEKGLYHGDLKLENILLDCNLKVFIADFATHKPFLLEEVFHFFIFSLIPWRVQTSIISSALQVKIYATLLLKGSTSILESQTMSWLIKPVKFGPRIYQKKL